MSQRPCREVTGICGADRARTTAAALGASCEVDPLGSARFGTAGSFGREAEYDGFSKAMGPRTDRDSVIAVPAVRFEECRRALVCGTRKKEKRYR